MWKHFVSLRSGDVPYSRNPLLLVSLSTSNPQYTLLYSQARELADYLLKTLSFERIASFYSSALPPAIQINSDGTLELGGVHLYHTFYGKRDLVLLAGQSSPIGEEYEFGDQILSYARSVGVKELVSVGARWNEEPTPPTETPRVLGFSSDENGVEELRTFGVEIQKEESAYFFANTVVALAPKYSMRGSKLSVNHGEPRPHPRSLISIVGVLSKMLRKEIDTRALAASAVELESAIRSAGLDTSQARAMDEGRLRQRDMYR